MLISVLIAAYKAGPYIATALASLRAQSHTQWELVVVEDGSEDGTRDIVQAFARECTQPVRYLNPGHNQGVAETRNLLIAEAKGEALAFLDADDRWEHTHLAKANDALEHGADFIVADVRAFELSTDKTLVHYSIEHHLDQNPLRALFEHSHIVTSSAVVLRASLPPLAGRFLTDLKVGEDRDYWMRCAKAGARFARTPLGVHYAKHPASTMARTLLVARQEVLFYEKYLQEHTLPIKRRRHLLARALTNLARLVRKEDPAEAFTLLKRAQALSRLNIEVLRQLLYTGVLSTLRAKKHTVA